MFAEIENILAQKWWGNSVLSYLLSIGLFIVLCVIVKITQYLLMHRLRKWSEKTTTTFDDFFVGLIQKILPFAYFGAFYISSNVLTLHPFVQRALQIIGMAILTLITARLVTLFIGYGFTLYWTKKGKDQFLERSLNGILKVVKLIIWTLAIIFFLDNLGFKISTVIAGLGIGGVAVALAAQAILGDLFSYFAILFDRPFEIGDFIIINEYLGVVEHIGIKTTRIRSLGGEQLVFSNTDLTNSRVRNYKRMEKRRVVFKLGVVYQTPLEQLKVIPSLIQEIITKIDDTIFDRAHFFSYGDFSLIFEVVYYVLSSDYNKYMDIQQEINFAIKKEFQKHGIEFAYPTQTVFVSKT